MGGKAVTKSIKRSFVDKSEAAVSCCEERPGPT